jgi:Ulp1 family protease
MADWTWNLSSIKHPKQNDSVNCGVYVSWFARNLIKNIVIPAHITEEELISFRHSMYEKIREASGG